MEVIAPELADQHEADLLAKEEAAAAQAARFTMTDDGHGKVHGRFTLPTLHGAMLKKMLLALAAPKHVAATEGAGVERRPGPERMGKAFGELIERISAKDLPKVGGRDATIVVTIDLDTLLRTPAEGRCPRHRRTHQPRRSPPPRLHRPHHPRRPRRTLRGPRRRPGEPVLHQSTATAMGTRDQGCVAEGCEWPPWMCHAHHWTDGPTAAEPTWPTAASSSRHHATAHDPTYEMTHHPHGKITFHRRP